jgi:hypothetical protein
MLLLIACSKLKHRHLKEGKACDIYKGYLLTYGLQYAKENNLRPLILSAKYGFITPDMIIESYDMKRETEYNGKWPKGSGYFLGGKKYFSNAPRRFRALVDQRQSYAEQRRQLLGMLKSTPKIKDTSLQKQDGVCASIYKLLCESRLTKQDLLYALNDLHGLHPKRMSTINAQLRQARMGVERNCIIRQHDNYYWIEPNA